MKIAYSQELPSMFLEDHPFSFRVTQQLIRFGVNTIVLISTFLIVSFSFLFTVISLTIFQGYVDTLGIVLCIAAPLLLFPLPAKLFFSVLLRLQNAEKELRTRNIELENFLGEVKTLSGLLPICCSCKKIRNDKGYWSEVEQYIGDHSDLQLTHGFCPECITRLYPDL